MSVAAQPLFDHSELLEITIEGDVTQLLRDDGMQRGWHRLRLMVNEDSLDVELRVRGNFRRRECTFPPVTVSFDRQQVAATMFAGQDTLKLVTHCKEQRGFSVNTFEEYLAYQLFNQVTEKSFRVRLLRVTYDYEGKKQKVRPAFFIEHVDGLARRLDSKHIEPDFVSSRDLDPLHLTQASIFQYMIGNTDFSFIAPLAGRSCCHNAKLFQSADAIYSVPYDFDFSGLVDAPYAGSNPVVKSSNVRRRKYRGFCTDAETLEAAMIGFESLELKLSGLFEAVTGLTEKEGRKALRYLREFFTTLGKSGTKVFETGCRRIKLG